MTTNKTWLPREGFTSEVLGPLIKSTLFNPALTLPLLLLARYTKRGQDVSSLHTTAFRRLRILFYLGLIRKVSAYFDRGSLDNWTPDTYDWEREIVVVTGGAGGIGGHVVRLLAEKGVKVVVLDVIEMSFEAPPNVHFFKCDITSSPTISSVAAKIRAQVGVPTILINNAGVARGKTILDSTENDIRFTFDVNTIAHFLLIKEFLPAMVARNHGMVVTVASTAAYVTAPNMVDYACSKAAALAFHEGLGVELKTKYGAPKVRTVCICPSYTKTALFQGYSNDSTFLMPTFEPETVAEGIVKQVLSGQSGQVIMPGFGATLSLLKGFPHWWQIGVRTGVQGVMSKWSGRQVIDIEKEYSWGGKGKEKADSDGGESSSTVLVPSTE